MAAAPVEAAPPLAEVLAELDSMANPKVLAVNQRHGDDHAVNLTQLRGVAKRLKTQPELARELWDSGSSDARLLALLITKPAMYNVAELDRMLRETRTPKTNDWLVNYQAKKHKSVEELRVLWFSDADPKVAGAGWALTSQRVAKSPEGLDLSRLLDQIEEEMVAAPQGLQWAMNECLATIGIHHPELRERALEIGERLGVLRDYPTPPGCTSPFAPLWIAEMVRRQEDG